MCNVGAGKSLFQASLKVHSVEEGRKEKHQSFPVHLHCLTAWLPACPPAKWREAHGFRPSCGLRGGKEVFCRIIMNELEAFSNGPNTEPWGTTCAGTGAQTTCQSKATAAVDASHSSSEAWSIIKHLKLSCMPLKNYYKTAKANYRLWPRLRAGNTAVVSNIKQHALTPFFFFFTRHMRLQIYDDQKLQKATLTQTISKENHHYLLGKFDPKTFRRQKRVYAPRSSLSFTNKHKSAGGTRSQVYRWTTKTRRRGALCQDWVTDFLLESPWQE